MKQITAGILAHVDAGKTTLSEGLLYQSGNLRKLGRVDNGDAFLDSDKLEKKRGITIFSHEAQITSEKLKLILLDTPGHIDFASQTENVLKVLDYAILVVSAQDGASGYTKVLWNLLRKRRIPTFIFVNKIDLPDVDKAALLKDLQSNLADNCLDFTKQDASFYENIATTDEKLLDEYLASGSLSDETIQDLIRESRIFPVYFGSALKLAGVQEFLAGLEKWTVPTKRDDNFKARIFKISHDQKGERLTWMKILGGQLQNKTELLPKQKINQLRDYDGDKFTNKQTANQGDIVAVTGLSDTYPGQGIGVSDQVNQLKPVMTYRLNPLKEDIFKCLAAMKTLQDENPELHLHWSEHLQEISVQVMGKVQLEVLEQILNERFNLQVQFDQGNILYQETISQEIEAVGHFEPLRHYSEVHFLLEPLPAGSGLIFESQCSLEVLAKNWQHQIMTALQAKEHLGVLTGSPLTDVKITLIGGKASNVHTVGGDFREASNRGVRQGLMELKQRKQVKLLEPWYDFTLVVPNDVVGRAITDIQKMAGIFGEPISQGDLTLITGSAPVSEMMDYADSVRSYSHGQGSLECVFSGYQDCHNSSEVIAEKNMIQ